MNEQDLIKLLYEVIIGMRNSPVRRATKILKEHGYIIPDNTKTYYTMQEECNLLKDKLAEVEKELCRLQHIEELAIRAKDAPDRVATWDRLFELAEALGEKSSKKD